MDVHRKRQTWGRIGSDSHSVRMQANPGLRPHTMPPNRNVSVLWIANFVTAAGMHAMVPFLTYFVEELGIVDPTARNIWAGILVGAAPVMAALMGPFWGAMGDRYGRKPMILRAMGAIVIFVGLMGMVQSVWVLLLLRLLQGCLSGFMPPSLALVSAAAPESSQGRLAGTMNSSFPAGAVFGFALGGWITLNANVRAVFPICATLAALGFLAVLCLVREDRSTLSGPRHGERSTFLKRIRSITTLPRLLWLVLSIMAVRIALATVDPHFGRFVDEVGGDTLTTGVIFSAQALALVCFMTFWGRIGDRRTPEAVFVTCSIAVAGCLVAQAMAQSTGELLTIRIVNGIFVAGLVPAGYALAARETPRTERGTTIGVVFMAFTLSHAIGSSLGGQILNLLGFRTMMLADAVVIVLVALMTLLRTRGKPTTPAA